LQQLNEGWFENMDAVPKKAITLTIPAIMNAKHINCFVPDNRKAKAVKNALEGDIVASCPASVLRKHSSVNLFLDPPAASLLS
jgi:glucosamine-6-phosphate deaminase